MWAEHRSLNVFQIFSTFYILGELVSLFPGTIKEGSGGKQEVS